jgi:pimeloyl-ACP methyl ester carboxylesterase
LIFGHGLVGAPVTCDVRCHVSAFTTSLDGARIAYEAHGAGSPALVFVHGWSCHRGYWDAQLMPLSANGLVVALDLAGHGESDATRQSWSIAAFGADVAAVIDDLGLKDAILIGHSMGADVILEALRRVKSRVWGLVLVDQHRQLSEFMTETQVRERMAPLRANFADTTKAFVRGMFPASANPSLVERVSTDMSSAPQEIALDILEATWNYGRNVPAILSELGVPLVSINSQDPSTDIESMRRHGIDVILMPGVGAVPGRRAGGGAGLLPLALGPAPAPGVRVRGPGLSALRRPAADPRGGDRAPRGPAAARRAGAGR